MRLDILILLAPFIIGGLLALISAWNAFRGKFHRHYWGVCAILLLISLLSLFVGEMGTTLDQDGILQEVGLLLPLGALLFTAATLGITLLSLLSGYFYFRRR